MRTKTDKRMTGTDRADLDAMTRAFLEKGGKITVCEPGPSEFVALSRVRGGMRGRRPGKAAGQAVAAEALPEDTLPEDTLPGAAPALAPVAGGAAAVPGAADDVKDGAREDVAAEV